jgi:hypothetical protein
MVAAAPGGGTIGRHHGGQPVTTISLAIPFLVIIVIVVAIIVGVMAFRRR